MKVVRDLGEHWGRTAIVAQSEVGVAEEGSRMFVFDPGVTLDEVVRAVNQVGAAPSDLVAILEALRQAGIPLLLLEGDCSLGSIEQQRTRIEAFIEMLV